MQISVPVSVGELIDKLTILTIKSYKVADNQKLKNIEHERTLLNSLFCSLMTQENRSLMYETYHKLLDINQKLWDTEDRLRNMEHEKLFDDRFIETARSVYFFNDKRASIKKDINLKLGSEIVEEKEYKKYS